MVNNVTLYNQRARVKAIRDLAVKPSIKAEIYEIVDMSRVSRFHKKMKVKKTRNRTKKETTIVKHKVRPVRKTKKIVLRKKKAKRKIIHYRKRMPRVRVRKRINPISSRRISAPSRKAWQPISHRNSLPVNSLFQPLDVFHVNPTADTVFVPAADTVFVPALLPPYSPDVPGNPDMLASANSAADPLEAEPEAFFSPTAPEYAPQGMSGLNIVADENIIPDPAFINVLSSETAPNELSPEWGNVEADESVGSVLHPDSLSRLAQEVSAPDPGLEAPDPV